MVFPTSPSNGQQITVANVTYEYNSTKAAWYRIISVSNGNISISVGNIVSGNVYSSNYYFANGTPFVSSTYSNTNVAAYLTSTYPITNDGALRVGTGSGPDVYVDALNDIFLGHGGTNYTTVNVDGRAVFSSNSTFSANATFSNNSNLTVNSGSNITVKSGGAIHLLPGAYIYGDGSGLTNISGTGGGGSSTVPAVTLDTFSGTGSQTNFTLATVPTNENYITVVIDGVTQLRSSYSVSGATLVFSEAPPNGSNIEVTTLSGVVGSYDFATRTYTGNGVQTVFTVTSGVTANSVIVTENGVVQTPISDYTVSETSLTFTTAPASNVAIQIREIGTLTVGSANIASTANTAITANTVTYGIQSNITGVGTLGNLTVSGTTTTGNIVTTNGLYWSNGTAFSSGLSSAKSYGMNVLFGS